MSEPKVCGPFEDGNPLGVAAHRHRNPDGSEGGWVAETAWVSGDALVCGNAWVYGNAWVCGDARVLLPRHVLVMGPVGSEDQAVTLARTETGHQLTIGCWVNGTVDALAAEVRRRCPDPGRRVRRDRSGAAAPCDGMGERTMTDDREFWTKTPRSFEECAAHLEAGGVVEEFFRHETWCDVKRIHTWPGMFPVRLVYSTPVGMSPVIGAPGHAYGLAEQVPEGWEGAVRASMPPCPLDTWVHDAIIEARPPAPPAADHVQTCERCKTEQSDSGWPDALCADHRETEVAMSTDYPTPDDLLYAAWGLIANACGGNWDEADKASPGWKAAAERWRDRWHETLATADEAAVEAVVHAMRDTGAMTYPELADAVLATPIVADAFRDAERLRNLIARFEESPYQGQATFIGAEIAAMLRGDGA